MKAVAKSSVIVSSLALLTAAVVHESAPPVAPPVNVDLVPLDVIRPVADTIPGTEFDDVLTGTESDDILIGRGGSDVLRGMDGDDILDGGDGDDVLDGGVGSDIIEAGEGADRLIGGDGDDSLFGDDGDDALRAGEGADVLDGGEGADALHGEDGDDTMDGGAGDDVLRGDDGDDLIDGGDGSDILVGGAGADDLDGGDESDILIGGDGDDVLNGRDGQDQLTGGAGDDLLSGGDGQDFVSGGAGNDEISGGDGDDVLAGQAGDDIIQGSQGADQINGGPGNDTLLGEVGPDVLSGGPGSDRLSGGLGEDRLEGGDENDQLEGAADTDQILGGSGHDTVILTSGDVPADREEIIEGGAGQDTLLLNGFLPDHISDVVEREPPPPDSADADSTATPMPELSFVVTDPLTGGAYRVSQMEVILYETRLLVAGGGEAGARAVVLNPASVAADVAIEFRGAEGESLVTPPGDSVPGWMSYSIPPLGVLEIETASLGLNGSATALLRSNVPVSAGGLGATPGLGNFGQRDVPRLDAARGPLEIDSSAGSSTALVLASEGLARRVQVQLRLADTQGTGEIDSNEVELPAGGHALVRLEELFPRVRDFNGSVAVAGGPIYGSILRTEAGRVSALPLFPAFPLRSEATPLYLPASVGDLGPTVLTILKHPGQNERAVGIIEFFDERGEPTSVDVDGEGAVASTRFELAGSGSEQYGLSAGEWASVRVQLDSGSVTAVARQELGPAGSALRGPATVGERLIAPLLTPADPGATRVAVQSTGPAATVELTLRGSDGQTLGGGSARISVPAGGSSTATVGELFPNARWGQGPASVSVVSTAPIALEALHLDSTFGSGFALPVRPLVEIE